MASRKFICAFKGRRDDYQVALALQEAGLLESLLTDIYWKDDHHILAKVAPRAIAAAWQSRHKDGLDPNRIADAPYLFFLERILSYARVAPVAVMDMLDTVLARRTGAAAARTGANLFCYSAYAPSAFRREYRHPARKIVFQYHPHWRTEVDVLARDQQIWAARGVTFTGSSESADVVGRKARATTDESWRDSDRIVCASSFTKRTLTTVGAPADRILVAPYGVEPVEFASSPEEAGPPTALFVGSGLQRKGLHHLLAAWGQARLPRDAKLVVVCRIVDPCLRDLIANTKQIEFKPGVSADELDRLYRQSSLFCMPSLIEGFGQVYLEALARGLPVLGTENTCVPDLGTEDDGVFCSPVGEVDTLTATLERLMAQLPSNSRLRRSARACAERHTWVAFRRKVAEVASSLTVS